MLHFLKVAIFDHFWSDFDFSTLSVVEIVGAQTANVDPQTMKASNKAPKQTDARHEKFGKLGFIMLSFSEWVMGNDFG